MAPLIEGSLAVTAVLSISVFAVPLVVQAFGVWLLFFPVEVVILTTLTEAAILFGALYIRRKRPRFSFPFGRKLTHIFGGASVVALGALYGQNSVWLFVCALLASYALYEYLRWSKEARLLWMPDVLTLLGSPEELEGKPFLEPLYGLSGMLLVSIFFSPSITRASIITLALGDGLATIAGKTLTSFPLMINPQKTFVGSFVGFTAAFIGCLFFVSPGVALTGALFGMLAEALSLRVSDNLTVSVISASAMHLMCCIL